MSMREHILAICWKYILEYLLDDKNSEISKAEIVKKLFAKRSPHKISSIKMTIGTKEKIFHIKYRRSEYPELKTWRKKVFERDNYTCQECGAVGYLHAHHIKRWAEYPDLRFDVDNGQTLCKTCHSKTVGYLRRNCNGI